jgi:hypothetical protein
MVMENKQVKMKNKHRIADIDSPEVMRSAKDEGESLTLESKMLDISTTKSQLVKWLEKFNAKYHPSVTVNTYHKDRKTILVRTQDLPSNPKSVYAILTVNPKMVDYEFYNVNETFNYLNQFYYRLGRGEIK